MSGKQMDNAWIHVSFVFMEKLQILFPEPQLHKLRGIAKKQDRPLSELIRNAVDLWLNLQGNPNEEVTNPPSFHCGKILAKPENFRGLANDPDL
jgi:hypothetical protein